MKTTKDSNITVSFHVEPADRSVGIMTEGFSARVEGSDCWCDLEDIAKPQFGWYDTETGIQVVGPDDHSIVERLLLAYANAWYDSQADRHRNDGPHWPEDRNEDELPTPCFQRTMTHWACEEKTAEEPASELLECPECHLKLRWKGWDKCIFCTPCPFPVGGPGGADCGDCTICSGRERFEQQVYGDKDSTHGHEPEE